MSEHDTWADLIAETEGKLAVIDVTDPASFEDADDAEDLEPPCPYCGEPAEFEIFEIWSWREFQISTCCEDAHEDAIDRMQDPAEARALLRELGIEDLAGEELRSVPDDNCGHLFLDWKPRIAPIRRDDARAFVLEHHAHNRPPAGWRYGAACYNGAELIGVVMVGRPVARRLDHRTIVEVNRLCVRRDIDPALVRHVCSKLYAWAAREARRRGFAKIVTYTLETEAGTTLRAAGWTLEHTTAGGSWNRASRPREDTAPTGRKHRWARELRRAA